MTCDALLIKKNPEYTFQYQLDLKKTSGQLILQLHEGKLKTTQTFFFKTNIDTIPLKGYDSFSLKWTSVRDLRQALFSVSPSIKDTHTIINKSVLDIDRIRRNQSLYSRKGRRNNKKHFSLFLMGCQLLKIFSDMTVHL